MTKICPKCLKLVSDSEACPDCGAVLRDIESWRSTRSTTAVEAETAPPGTAWIESSSVHELLDVVRNPSPDIIDGGNKPLVANQYQTMDWTKFVLGVLISSLVFFCTFLAAYVASGAAE